MCVYFWALDSVPLIYVSIFMPASYCFDYYSFVIKFEIKSVMPPALFFFFKMVLAIWGLLWFHMNFFPISVKNVIGILIGIALNL